MTSQSLSVDDYLTPFTIIRDIIRNPNQQSQLSPPQLLALLSFHLNRLKACWHPFSSSSSNSQQELKGTKVRIPHTSHEIEIDESLRALTLKLAQRIGIDQVECLMLIKGAGSLPSDLNQLTYWWSEQALAVPQTIIAIDQLASLSLGEWSRVAEKVRSDIIGDEPKYVEGLFRAWGGLAQKPLEGAQRVDEPLFWARQQLRLQNDILELLFRILASRSDWPANTVEGLIKGSVMSNFGGAQANPEIWRDDETAEQLQARLSSLIITIALESLALSRVNDSNAGIERGGDLEDTVFQSQNHITPVTLFLLQVTEDLAPSTSDNQIIDPAIYSSPISVLCLAWAIFLNSLPQNLQPPQTGFDKPLYQVLAERTLSPRADVVGRLEHILQGSLYGGHQHEAGGDSAVDLIRRQPYKHLLIGLADLLHFEHIPDKASLQRVWTLLFGQASPLSSLTLCQDFWEIDDLIDNRRAILDKSTFPRYFDLPNLLSALSGLGSSTPLSQLDTVPRPSLAVFDYFSKLSSITLPLDPIGGFRVTGKDGSGRLTIETMRHINLPGGAVIPAGTSGLFTGGDEDTKRYVRLNTEPISGWQLLVEILRTVVGQRSTSHRDRFAPMGADFVYLSVEDLGIEEEPSAILFSGLQLLRAVLHPVFDLGPAVLDKLSYGAEASSVLLLNLALTVLEGVRVADNNAEAAVAEPAIEIVGSLLAQDNTTSIAMRNSSFFGALGKRRSIAADLIHTDAGRGEHRVTLAVLRLVQSIVSATSSTVRPDAALINSALHLVISAIWTQASGWRYRDAAVKYDVFAQVNRIFSSVLSHPRSSDPTTGVNTAAQYLIEVFVSSATTITYRPILDITAQAVPLAFKLMNEHRSADSAIIVESLESTLVLLSTLLRVSAALSSSSQQLPKSILALPIVTPSGDKMQLVDLLFDLASHPAIPASTRLLLIKLVRTYLESTGYDAQRPSLAAMLRSADASCAALTEIAVNGEDSEVRSATWLLLSSIVSTQPGCVLACIGRSGDGLSGALQKAADQVLAWEEIVLEEPHLLSAVLAFCHSALISPISTRAVQHLREQTDFWNAVYEISLRSIPSPPTFTLSMHSEDFALRIRSYAYAVQSKANATQLLAAELANLLDQEDGPETKTQSLLLGLFRNNTSLTEAAVAATHNSCKPSLHEEEGGKLERLGVRLGDLRTIALQAEREYGREYLYDANPTIPHNEVGQATVNLALDMLNLNWSMLDADIALTKAFRSISERISAWTEGDALAARASLRASVAIAEVISEEERGGDVMLAIQAERLETLATLLETAVDKDIEPDTALLGELCGSVRRILESTIFPPMVGLRHPELPALHKPILRIVFLLLQGLPASQIASINVDPTIEAITSFTLEAADVVFDTLRRQQAVSVDVSVDLGAIIGVLCEITQTPNTALWLDKLCEHNIFGRSLDIITRSRIEGGNVERPVANVLSLHLATASNRLSAEKLAVSGVLPAYSDNAVAVEAEQGRIESTSAVSSPHTVHGAWCGILLVVKALLSSLPATDVSSFAKSDVVPFIRVCTPQLLKAMSWDGETALSGPTTDELALSCDVFYGIAQAIGPNEGLLYDFSVPALGLLKSIRFGLAHPRSLSNSFVPRSEEERAALEKELEAIEKVDNPILLDFAKTPTIASRTTELLGISRTVVLALVLLTKAWEVLANEDEVGVGSALESEDEVQTANDDPVGILNDIHLTISSYLSHLSPASRDPAVQSARSILIQLQESTAVLSTSQLLIRHSASPHERDQSDDSMEIDSGNKRRVSLGSLGPADRSIYILRELEGDLRGILPDGEDGQRGLLVRLRHILEGHFGVD